MDSTSTRTFQTHIRVILYRKSSWGIVSSFHTGSCSNAQKEKLSSSLGMWNTSFVPSDNIDIVSYSISIHDAHYNISPETYTKLLPNVFETHTWIGHTSVSSTFCACAICYQPRSLLACTALASSGSILCHLVPMTNLRSLAIMKWAGVLVTGLAVSQTSAFVPATTGRALFSVGEHRLSCRHQPRPCRVGAQVSPRT